MTGSPLVGHPCLPYARLMTTTVSDLDAFSSFVGQHLGYSAWHRVDQDQVDLFADATGDHQWIHVDVAAAAAGPFGGPIAHGYLTLSLAPMMLAEIFVVTGVAMGVNYGINRLRFPAPVPVGSRLRAGAELSGADRIAGGAQVTLGLTFEVEAATKPSCVAELVFRYYEHGAGSR